MHARVRFYVSDVNPTRLVGRDLEGPRADEVVTCACYLLHVSYAYVVCARVHEFECLFICWPAPISGASATRTLEGFGFFASADSAPSYFAPASCGCVVIEVERGVLRARGLSTSPHIYSERSMRGS